MSSGSESAVMLTSHRRFCFIRYFSPCCDIEGSDQYKSFKEFCDKLAQSSLTACDFSAKFKN